METEFTDALLTGCGGWSVLVRLAKKIGLLKLLSGSGAWRGAPWPSYRAGEHAENARIRSGNPQTGASKP